MENRNQAHLARQVKYRRLEMRRQLWSYALSIVLTVFAFLAVGSTMFEDPFAIVLFVLLLAVIQILFQLAVFMHLKDKGHFFPNALILAASLIALIVVFGIKELMWW